MSQKRFSILFLCVGLSVSALAQDASNGAMQHLNLELEDVVNVNMFGSSSGPGTGSAPVEMPIVDVNALAHGIESNEIKVDLLSTSVFDIHVSASSNLFSYAGSAMSTPSMPVSSVLSVVVTENNTGGSVVNGYTSYQPVYGTIKTQLLDACPAGQSSFKFKYKATPGLSYPAGTYTADIIYTISKK